MLIVKGGEPLRFQACTGAVYAIMAPVSRAGSGGLFADSEQRAGANKKAQDSPPRTLAITRICVTLGLRLPPLVLGFYVDDWGMLLETANRGGPFSLERLEYAWQTFARPLMNLEVWVATSVLGKSPVAWHFFLLALAAVSYVMLRRLLLELGTRPAVATIASTAWLLFPWALGYRVWPVCFAIRPSTIFFLAGSTSLLRKRLWPALGWYAASLLTYEAFYFAFFRSSSSWRCRPRLGVGRYVEPRHFLSRSRSSWWRRIVWPRTLRRTSVRRFPRDWYLRLPHIVSKLPLTLSEGVAGPLLFSFTLTGCVLVVGLVAAAHD